MPKHELRGEHSAPALMLRAGEHGIGVGGREPVV
jgi:hypothetical protein